MYNSLIDVLLHQKDTPAAVQVIAGTAERRALRYDALYAAAGQRLSDLRAKGLNEGSYCVLYLQDELAFVETFWACILGGIIPVPIAPGNTANHREKLFLVAQELKQCAIMTEADAIARFEDYLTQSGSADAALDAQVIEFAPLAEDTPTAQAVTRSRDDVAFIQFSSGSTRTPKGVVLTHGNLLDNLEDLQAAFGLVDNAVALSWMPLTHDMGLIGFHLCPLFAGIDHHIMRTSLFIRRPLAWLDLAAELGATTLGSPNFGYRHWLKAQAKAGADLPDLSAVRQIINGAEPISMELTREFMDTLAPGGLSEGVMCPSYGLAEATLGISVAAPGPGARVICADRNGMKFGDTVPVVDAGHPGAVSFAIEGPIFPHSEVRIGTEDGVDLGTGALGEVQLRGSNVTSGYLNQDPNDSDLFTHDGWLRTWDLGFLHEGELVITGRLKDMIVYHGQNYFAPDIEMLVQDHGLAEIGEAAAGVIMRMENEGFALFLRERAPGLDFIARAKAARQLIFEHTGLNLVDVVPVRAIPKTTSGKIRRAALAQEYLAGDFAAELDRLRALAAPKVEVVAKPTTADVVIEKLRGLLDGEDVDPAKITTSSNFFEAGLSSIVLAELTDELNDIFPDVVDVTDFFEHATAEVLAGEIDRRMHELEAA